MLRKKALAIVLIMIIIGSVAPKGVYATSTWDKLQEAQKKNEETKKEQKENEDAKEEIKGKENKLNNELNVLNSELQEVTNNLEKLEAEIDENLEEIEKTEAELREARETEKNQYEAMKMRLEFMYMNAEEAYIEMLFKSEGLSEFLNKARYIEELSGYDNEQLDKYEATRKEIELIEKKLKEKKVELDELHVKVSAEQDKFNNLVDNTRVNLNATRAELDEAEKRALELEKQAQEEEENIASLRKKYEAELALSQLAANSAWRNIDDITFSDGDRYLLASLIYCEAGGESYAGQLAVGSVVINRLLSSRYPDALSGVVYQPHQFSPANSYGGNPPRLTIAMANNKATASCYKAADEAMKGYTNVQNCLYFRTPIAGINPRYTIGGHIFY